MPAPKWAVGMRRVGPGMYVKDHQLHFSARELCEVMGVSYTPQNAELLKEVGREAIKEVFGIEPECSMVEDDQQ